MIPSLTLPHTPSVLSLSKHCPSCPQSKEGQSFDRLRTDGLVGKAPC